MTRFIDGRLKSRILFFLLYSFIATSLIAPIATENYIPGLADYVNHLASIIQAKMAFAEGQFPLRIAPLQYSGFRYPIFQFYSPTTYTIAGLIYQYLTPTNPMVAYKLTAWIGLLIGGIYMNRLTYWFVKSRIAALLASLAYLTSPYYIIVMNNFGDLSEVLGLGILPVVVFYTLQRYLRPNIKTFVKMSLAWYLLMTIHIVTFIYTSFFVAILLIMLTIKNKRHWKNLISTSSAYGLSLLLAMWYFAPITLLAKYLVINETFSTAASFTSFKPVLAQLLFPGAQEFQAELNYNHPSVGWILIISFLIAIYASIQQIFLKNKRANYWLPFFVVLFGIAFLLTWSPFNFWKWIPHILFIGQYSWRLLGQVIWIGAILFAWAFCWLFKDKLDHRHTVIGALLIVMTSSAYFPTIHNSNINVDEFIKKPLIIYNEQAYVINFVKHTKFVSLLDAMNLDLLMLNHQLVFNEKYSLTKELLNYAYQPILVMHAEIPSLIDKNLELQMWINDVNVSTKKLTPGILEWTMPLDEIKNQFKNSDKYYIQFKLSNIDAEKDTHIKINQLQITGFLSQKENMDVDTVKSKCQLEKATTICDINVPQNIKMLELPILYYPQLLKIMLNGKKTSYQGIMKGDMLLAGIIPQSGKQNHIEIQFIGLQWANSISLIFWSVWGLFALVLVLNFFRNVKLNE
jgi:hypothetical protein